MQAIANEAGKVTITLRRDDATLSFAIGAMDGEPFAPGAAVEIADERLNRVIDQVGAPFGLTHKDRVWESIVS